MRHEPRTIARVVLTLFLGLAGLSSLTSCGGGPSVASATGHYLYLASSNGIYGFSLMSNNTLTPLSNSALASGAYTAVVVDPTPGGVSSPVLYAVSGGTTITSFAINGNGTLGSAGSLSPGACLADYSGLSVTADGNWLLAVDNAVAASNIVAIDLKTNACGTSSSVDSTHYPITLAVNCTLSGGNCNVLVTEAAAPDSTTPSTQVLISSWNSSTGAFPGGTPTTLGSLGATAQSVLFDTATLYFYLTAPSSNLLGSLTSSPTTSSTFTATQSFSPITSTPCLDVLSNALYLPTTNGSVYQLGVDASGNIQSPSQLWSLSSTPSIPTIYACAILD